MNKNFLIKSSLLFAAPFLYATAADAATISVENTNRDAIVADATEFGLDATSESLLNNLGISIADTYVNIRKEPGLDAEIVGKLYQGSAVYIEEVLEGWVKVVSGNVEGYIFSEYLAIGDSAEEVIDQYAEKTVTVTTETLKLRDEKSTESMVLDLVGVDESFKLLKESKNWVKVKTDLHKGFLSKDYVDVCYSLKSGITLEEEKEQEEAAAREAAARAAAEQAAQTVTQTSRPSSSSSNKSSSSTTTKKPSLSSSNASSSSSSTTSATGSKIASYALQFVGNPYVYGGTSLTNGTDCSGFVQSVYRNFGYSLPRTSGAQAGAGRSVSVSEMQPGDLIFYSNGSRINHVAIYVGNSRVVHASNPKTGITTSVYNYRTPVSVRRIIG